MPPLFAKTIASLLAPHLNQPVEEIESALEIPPNATMGDVAFPCFKLAAVMKKGPPQIAKEIAAKIKPKEEIIRVGAAGPYVNFFYDPKQLAKAVMNEKNIPMVPAKPLKNPKTIIEYCQANPLKAFHIGHLRNIVLGECICRLFESRGVPVFRMNYGGDVGPHVSKALYAYQNLWKGKEPTKVEEYGQWLGSLYALGATKVKGNEELEQKMRDMVVQLEQGDPKLVKDWLKLRKMSLEYLNLTFKKLGTTFDRFMLESEVEKPGIKLVKELEKKGFAKKSEGALVVDLTPYKLDHFLVLKKDGAALYATKDLALAQYKKKELGMDVSYNLVGAEQSFYFKQLTKTIELLNAQKEEYCKTVHLSYELVVLESGKMSSRDGDVVSFEELHAEVKEKAVEETSARRTEIGRAHV